MTTGIECDIWLSGICFIPLWIVLNRLRYLFEGDWSSFTRTIILHNSIIIVLGPMWLIFVSSCRKLFKRNHKLKFWQLKTMPTVYLICFDIISETPTHLNLSICIQLYLFYSLFYPGRLDFQQSPCSFN